MTRYLRLMAAAHSDEPWTASQHVDVDDPQLVDYAVEAGLLGREAPCAEGYGDGNGNGDGDGDGNGFGFGDGNGFGFGDGYGDGDGYSYGDGDGNGHGNGNGDGDGAVLWPSWSSCPYYHEEEP